MAACILNKNMENKTIIIVGPTCTGKTSLAIKLCKQYNGSIISADSRQVVRYMDIGTGKVPAGENDRTVERKDDRWIVDGVDVFGYDLVDPDVYFSAYDFVGYCKNRVPQISRDGKNVFLVGGTGFYIDAVTGRATLEGIGPDIELRRGLEILSTEELAEMLSKLDKSAYKSIDKDNPARLVRAVEKATQVKKSDRAVVTSKIINSPVYLGLTADRETLYQRADKWVDGIFNERLFEEVRHIQARFPKSHRLKGLIYKGVVDYIDGVTNIKDSAERVKFDMHGYIRRQQTWFKRNTEIKWFDITQENFDADVTSIVESELNG